MKSPKVRKNTFSVTTLSLVNQMATVRPISSSQMSTSCHIAKKATKEKKSRDAKIITMTSFVVNLQFHSSDNVRRMSDASIKSVLCQKTF